MKSEALQSISQQDQSENQAGPEQEPVLLSPQETARALRGWQPRPQDPWQVPAAGD